MTPTCSCREFHAGLVSDHVPLTGSRLWLLGSTLARYLFWLLFNELALHFFYFNAAQYQPSVLVEADLWTLCGIAYAMGQFFHMKYVVFYGVPRAFLLSDNIEPPAPTKCVSRIHLYSDMWRYFDNGLYRLIHKYYYWPFLRKVTGGDRRGSWAVRLGGSFVTFAYVFVWHGLQKSVFVWSALNFAGVTLEAVARAVGAHPKYQNVEVGRHQTTFQKLALLEQFPLSP